MPSFNELTKRSIEEWHTPLLESDNFGDVDLERMASGQILRAMVTITRAFWGKSCTGIELKADTGAFEVPPTVTLELGREGPRIYIHGVGGELALVVTFLVDGSVNVEKHTI